MKVINVSSGADGAQFHHENVMSTAFIFLLGAAQRQTGGSFIRKKLYPLHLFFFDCYGYARGFSGAVQGQRYVHGIYFSLNTGGINGALD